jgi:hypothetical protein
MHDPRTFWLTVTNIALGAALLLLILGLVTGVLCEFIAKLRRRHAAERELDREMRHWFGESHPHK